MGILAQAGEDGHPGAFWIGHEVLLTNESYLQALFLLPYCLKSFNIQVVPLIT